MRNSLDEQCDLQNNCLWVVDAFRLTWKGTDCVSCNQSEEVMHTGEGAEGTLLLQLNMADGDDKTSVQVKVQNQKAILEYTLARHFGYDLVNIVEARFVAPGRRLREQHVALMRIDFVAYKKVNESTVMNLKEALQANLDTISPGITVVSANVDWSHAASVHAENVPQNIAHWLLYIIIIIACISLVLAGIAAWKFKVCKTNTRTLETDLDMEKPEDPEEDEEVPSECIAAQELPEDLEDMEEVTSECVYEDVEEETSECKHTKSCAEESTRSLGPFISDDGTLSAGSTIPDEEEVTPTPSRHRVYSI